MFDRCIDCSRPLKSLKSRERGRGGACYAKTRPSRKRASTQVVEYDPRQQFLPFPEKEE
jgi:hypothetical protein